jgi:hypothetical protein
MYCTSLRDIVIPKGVKRIEAGAFCNCTSLTTVVLPVGVAKIGKYAFADCPALSTISVPAGKADYYKKRLPQNLHQYIVEREPEKKAKK